MSAERERLHERLIALLVMTPLSDTAGTELRPFQEAADYLIDHGVTVKPDTTVGDLHLSIRTGRKVERVLYVQLGDKPSDDDPDVAYVKDPAWAYRLRDAHNATREACRS